MNPSPNNVFLLSLWFTLTEQTLTSVLVVTKAGVPSYKIFVGESSYGRSFKMAKAGCDAPMCTFTGDRLNSDAMPGACTDTVSS